jgi:hypothetical protein
MNEIIEPNPIFLEERGGLRRLPTQPELKRPIEFWDGFDAYGLFYDVFRDVDGKRIWLVGPDVKNLRQALEEAHVVGLTSGVKRRVKTIYGCENCVACVSLPTEDQELQLNIGGQSIVCRIGRNLSTQFAGKRTVLCINQDNHLDWMRDWARFYHLEHGANAVCIFDNNSQNYSKDDMLATLQQVAGIETVRVVNWPFKFGVMDKLGQDNGLNQNVRFAQPPMYPAFFLRLGQKAASILNVDVDELVLSSTGKSIFSSVERRLFGTIKFDRFLVENAREATKGEFSSAFLGFHFRDKNRTGRQDNLRKWAIAPRKLKVTKKTPMPWTHRVYGVLNPYPVSKDFKCYHFASVNTGWRAKTQKGERKEWQHQRHIPVPFDPEKHVKDEFLANKLSEIFGQKNG